MKNCLKNFLRFFDYFGVVFTFRIKEKYSYQSTFGGLIFLHFLFFAVLYLVYSLRIFLSKELYSMRYFTSVITPSPAVDFHNSGVNIAYSLVYDNYTKLNDEVYEIFKDKLNLVKIMNSDVNKKNKTEIITSPCTMDDFYNKIDKETFKSLNISNFNCAKTNGNMIINGSFADDLYQYIEVDISLKPNAFTNNINKTINLNYISNYMKMNPIKIVIYWLDTSLEVQNGNVSMSNYLNSYMTYIDFSVIKKINMEYGLTKLYIDYNYILRNPVLKQNITFDEYQESTLITQDRLALDSLGKTLVKFYIRSSPKNHLIIINYMKISEFLANFGGLMSNVLLFLFILVRVINNFRSEQKLMNDLYRYSEHYKIFNPMQVNLINTHFKLKNTLENNSRRIHRINSHENIKSFTKFSQESDKNDPILDKTIQNHAEIEMKEINRSINRRIIRSKSVATKNKRINSVLQSDDVLILSKSSKPLNFSSWEIIISLFQCRTKSIILKEKLHSRAVQKTQYYLDIYTYIKKIQEIDLLKYILLDQNQSRIFKFLSKPSVSIANFIPDNVYENIHSNQLIRNNIKNEEFEEVINSFNVLKNKNDEVSQRLVNFFEYEAVSLIE
jgi:hypothetical protein